MTKSTDQVHLPPMSATFGLGAVDPQTWGVEENDVETTDEAPTAGSGEDLEPSSAPAALILTFEALIGELNLKFWNRSNSLVSQLSNNDISWYNIRVINDSNDHVWVPYQHCPTLNYCQDSYSLVLVWKM